VRYGAHKLNFVLLDSACRRRMPVYWHCYPRVLQDRHSRASIDAGVGLACCIRFRLLYPIFYVFGKVFRAYEESLCKGVLGLRFSFFHSSSAWFESLILE
jgi:hypothetical protein